MEKPITMRIEETKESLVAVINESRLPAWLMRDVLRDIYEQVNRLAIQQAEQEKKAYLESEKEDD